MVKHVEVDDHLQYGHSTAESGDEPESYLSVLKTYHTATARSVVLHRDLTWKTTSIAPSNRPLPTVLEMDTGDELYSASCVTPTDLSS